MPLDKTSNNEIAHLIITDMTCGSCVNHIQQDLLKQEGITEAKVNFATSQAEITYDDSLINESKIIEIIKKTGYTAQSTPTANSHASSHQHLQHNHGMHSGHNHAAAESTSEMASKKIKLISSGILSIIILILLLGFDFQYKGYIAALLSFIILSFSGREFYTKGIPAFFRGRPGMNSLVAISMGAAFLFSIYNIFWGNPEHEYFMDVAIITTFILLGRYLEAVAKGKASEAIKKLLKLSAKTAHKLVGDTIEDIPIDAVQAGDLLLVKPGEKIPVDGVITKGEATINESMITGESIPVDKIEQDQVIGATINGNTSFTMKAEKVGKETMLANIIKMVEEAQISKAPIQKLVDTISGYFVWGVLAIGVLTYVSWYLITGDTTSGFIATVAVLIIACPCALGLATPISMVVGSGKGASMGILLKKSESLEKMHKVTAMCFDKTGTITKGHPDVHFFKSVSGDETQNLAIALGLENFSEHPLAKSIVKYVTEKTSTKPAQVENFSAVTGKGVTGKIENKEYYLGSISYIKSLKIPHDHHSDELEILQKEGNTVLILADKKEVKAFFGVKDEIKETSKMAVKLLRSHNITPVMLTGDNERVAKAIANEVGIKQVHAEVSPGDKTDIVKKLQQQGHLVAMVGDGINDSPALTQSDVGIAMGTGTDIAMESGDMVLIKGNLLKAIEAIELSAATYNNIKQNLFWAFAYNSVSIPIAALGFLNPMVSSIAMGLSSVSVVLNALRLKRFKLGRIK